MPRNEPQPLSSDDLILQRVMHKRLMSVPTGRSVEVTYVKRNGAVSSSRGTIEFFNGQPGYDTGSVTIADPVKGNRTVNIHRITRVE